MVSFKLPAAAEAAGFRPCPQCRPDRLAGLVGWSEPEPLCRAVRLILEGALDEAGEACLAARLGLSGRHLRRLFITRLGVTPDGLARSRRAHFARRLLDDTDLSITEIAFAAGYGTGRQFNRDCQRIFRATPSQLRASRSSPCRLAADGGLTVRLWYSGALDWEALAAFLADRAMPGVEHVAGQIYRRTIDVDGDPGVLELGPGGSGHLQLRLHLPHWAGLMHLVARARRIASLDQDITEPARSQATDVGRLPGSRPIIPGAWDPYETGTAAIIAQHHAPEATRNLLSGLVHHLGKPVPGLTHYRLTHAFPPPGVLAAAEASLAAMGLHRDQARAVSAFADAVATGAIRLDGSAPLDQLITSLTAIPNLGVSTAHYIAARAGEPDAHPASDPALSRAIPLPSSSHGAPTGLPRRGPQASQQRGRYH